MRALLDVNVLIALLDADHVSHGVATRWFGDEVEQGWASSAVRGASRKHLLVL